ncbi:MAG TPA: hypothetical protein VMJ32_11635 [Pirellulales bacterium]|nr:hypothetical protein [Pirellulales bacterium]
MYSLKINIIGCDDRVLPPVAREILHRWAIIDVDYPSMAAAIQQALVTESEPRLFVVNIDSADAVQELKRLSGSFAGCPIVAIVDTAIDSTLVVRCMRAGATQVIQSPVDPEDLGETLNCIKAQHGRISTLARLVAVSGAVGGCGGSMIAINMTDALARLQRAPCILMELALRKGVLANHLDITPRYSIADLVADIQRVDSFILRGALTEVAENFSALAGPYQAIESVTADTDTVMRLVTLTRHLASWLVLDVPCTYDELFFRALTTADQIVVVVDQTVAAIRGAQMVCDGIGQRQPLIVINRYNPKIEGLTVDRIQRFLPTCQICTVEYDTKVIDSMNHGQALRLHAPHSPILPDIDHLATVIDSPVPADQTNRKQSGLLDRIARVFSLS